MAPPRSLAPWFQRTIAWSNSRQSWEERLGGLALLAGAGCLFWYGRSLGAVQKVVLWGLLLVVAAILLRRGWIKLFGPVLFYDLVRSGRRGRYILLRCCYAGILLLLMFSAFLSSWTPAYYDPTPQELSARAERYFEILMFAQLTLVLLLTPVFVAGAVAEEKERRTLEYLLATDLRGREIILSKLTARLASLTLLVLTGLPIVSILQFMGGVDPNLVLGGFAAVGLTMLGLGGLGILLSTYLRKPRDAIALTYVGLVTYYVLSFFGHSLVGSGAAFLGWTVWPGTTPWTVADLLQCFNAGNLLLALSAIRTAGGSGTLAQALPLLLGSYSLFNSVVAGVCITWAVLRLRAVAIKQMQGPGRRRRDPLQLFRRPRLRSLPMMWKEVYVEGSTRLGWLARLFLGTLIAVTFLYPGYILFEYYLEGRTYPREFGVMARSDGWPSMAMSMNVWVRYAGTLVGCLTLLWVAVRASTCVSRERDRQTLDALLTTPLDSSDILLSKCLGNILGVRRLWFWLGGIWLLGLLTGGLHAIALVLAVAAWFVYAAFLSVLGTWFSVTSRTSLRATVWTLLSAGFLGMGHWLIWACCIPVLFTGGGFGPDQGVEHLAKFQAGLTPPVSLAFLQFSGFEFADHPFYDARRESMEVLAFCLFGLFIWGLFTVLVWVGVSARFRDMTNRVPVNEPDFVRRGRRPTPRQPRISPGPPPVQQRGEL